MEYALAKSIHLCGLALWLAVIPIEIYTHYRLSRGTTASEALGMVRIVNLLRYVQEFPGLVIAVGGGVWLAHIQGVTPLLAQPWFLAKLAFIAYLVFAETYLTLASMKLERELAHSAANGLAHSIALDLRELLVECLALFAGACVLILVMFRTLPMFGLLSAVTVAAAVALLLARREARPMLVARQEARGR